MKINILLSSLIIISIMFSSCAKEYACECDATRINMGIEIYKIRDTKRTEAKAKCEEKEEGRNGAVSCALK